MNNLVELKNIKKVYASNYVLRDVSLSIEKNKNIAILGGNGTGKSTLLRIIAGIERPSSGDIYHPNKEINIGYVPERFPKNIRFTPGEYLHYIGRMNGISSVNLQKNIPDYIQRFQLEEVSNKWIMNLSKGNIQKVGIIQAILDKPDLLILDEPISGLDAHAQQELLKLLKEMNEEGTTVLLTYHESNILEGIVDTAYHLSNGSITKMKQKKLQEMKLIEIEKLDEGIVISWDEVLFMKKVESRLILYVHVRDSDMILTRILQLKGTIRRVDYVVDFYFHDEKGQG